jgi:hypothetical protein
MNNELRNGNFTSSEIVALTKNGTDRKSPGKPFYTYIDECNMERRLGRSVSEETNAKPIAWGNLNEPRVFQLLGTEYSLISKETIVHPTIDYWAGSPDALKYVDGIPETVCDIKCPKTLKSFCQLVDGWARHGIDGIRYGHLQGEKYYWQLVSNAVLTGCNHAELIVYAPYKSELDAIRKSVDGNGKYYWIWGSSDEELPYLIDGGHYKNLNVFRFDVPFLDKQFLEKRVLEGGELLINRQLITV